jgi:hypothetical protein
MEYMMPRGIEELQGCSWSETGRIAGRPFNFTGLVGPYEPSY